MVLEYDTLNVSHFVPPSVVVSLPPIGVDFPGKGPLKFSQLTISINTAMTANTSTSSTLEFWVKGVVFIGILENYGKNCGNLFGIVFWDMDKEDIAHKRGQGR
jgi:hypothetical protein